MNLKLILCVVLLYCCCNNHAFVINRCPKTMCNCTRVVARCTARNTSELQIINNATFHHLELTLDVPTLNITFYETELMENLKRLIISSRINKKVLLKFIRKAPNLDVLSMKASCSDKALLRGIFLYSNVTYVNFIEEHSCSYQRVGTQSAACNGSCFFISNSDNQTNLAEGHKAGVCVCRNLPTTATTRSSTTLNTTLWNSNLTNITNFSIGVGNGIGKPQRYYDSMNFSIILGTFSIIALVSNFIILAKMCRCQAQSVSKIFGISIMLFNILLAEYGIALAVYLTQEDGNWDRSFCQVMTAMKLFAMCADIFALLCLTFQWSINPPDDNYNKLDVRFKAIVYILEGFVLAGMTCVLAWTKFDNWGYLCDIYRPVKVAEKIIVSVEYCYHCALFLLALRFPYKTFRRKEPAQSYIKMKYVVEREHPVFVMVCAAFLLWSVPFFVTIPATGLGNVHLTPLIRNCALMAGAFVLPFLFVIRNSRICCSKHTACGVNDPRVCQCKGRSSEMCYACEVQHKDMITNCEFHSFGDRRKSLSLDDLKFVLGVYKKHTHCSMKIKKKKLISRSFPIINMDTIEEADVEDITDIDRLFLGKPTNFELSIESPLKHQALLSRENTTSMPNLSSPKKLPTAGKKRLLQAKLSLSPRKSALLSPVKRSLSKKRAASLDNRLLDRNADSSASDRSTTSSPIKSDNETNLLLKDGKKSSKQKRKNKSISKSKESVKSKDSSKSKDSLKKLSKNTLEVEALNTDSSGPASPNRVSRIPSFIPLTDAGSSDSLKRKKSTSSNKNSPAKTKPSKSKLSSSKGSLKSKDDEEAELLGEDPNRVPSRGPTFFLVGEEDDVIEDAVKKPLLTKEKKAKRGVKKQRKIEGRSKEGTPLHEVDDTHGSRKSLEWDPSYSLSDSSCSSPVDEFSPPQPAPPPSNYALERVKEMGVRHPDSPHVSIGRGSSYSMDWDPTGIQIRHSLASPCDWEPYSVDEARSTPTSPEAMTSQTLTPQTMTSQAIKSQVMTPQTVTSQGMTPQANAKNQDSKAEGENIAKAPLATLDV